VYIATVLCLVSYITSVDNVVRLVVTVGRGLGGSVFLCEVSECSASMWLTSRVNWTDSGALRDCSIEPIDEL